MKNIILALVFIPFVSISQIEKIEKYNKWSQRTEHANYLVNHEGYEAVRLTVQIDSMGSNPKILYNLEKAGFKNLVFSFTPIAELSRIEYGVLINEMSLYDFKLHLESEFSGVLFLSEEPFSF